ncbi:MAG: YgjP-like metallopeptidase domain-containing protein [Alkalibacterium sp.]|nr:YgjP-like metallopeptidase domain-containing protein [Alkalibacterium sp.]
MSISQSIRPLEESRLAVPEDMDEEAIRLFVISKLAWIKKQRKQFKLQDRQSAREYVSGESHYFLGSRYL